MSDIHLITVGKLKNKNILALEQDYLKRLKNIKFTIHELKSQSENLHKEEELILKKIDSFNFNYSLILLTEFGKTFDSPSLSKYIYNKFELKSNIVFVIGGAAGFGEQIKNKTKEYLSLSLLTYPHQFARLIFIEQIYRAETIYMGHPYNK